MQPCQNEKTIEYINRRLERIEDKLDLLLEDKGKRLGAVAALTITISTTIALLGLILR